MPDASFTEGRTLADLRRRLFTCSREKLFLLVVLTVLFCVPYFYLTRHAFMPIHRPPELWIDRLAGFHPAWVWGYESLYLITGTLPWLARNRADLGRFTLGFALLAASAFAIFAIFPTQVLHPSAPYSNSLYAFLLAYDGPYNALPSLHAGLLYYTLAFARRVYGRPAPVVSIFFFLWSCVILWSTMAIKQHHAIDLLAGGVLAVVCDAVAWSRIFRSVDSTSHSGRR
jgi:membrane-associated phospholipid phosphatase